MGIATTREEIRGEASMGMLSKAPTIFESCNNVCNAGVLFLIPALLSQGLLKGVEIYGSLKKGYYGLVHILLLLAFMALSRIKNPEQLKVCKPGELGKIMGLDRVPEAKCLRLKINQIVLQGKAKTFSRILARKWITEEGCFYFYIDGHVKIYHGKKATLTKKYVSRQKLCLAGTTEFWVNNELGLPYLMVTGELNEKLKDIILKHIIPELLKDTKSLIDQQALNDNADLPRFTIIFDREAYEPAFFKTIWEKHRIAVITYRKNVKDKWDESLFKPIDTKVISKNITMHLYEKEVELAGMKMRETRKLGENGHQTSIITTNNSVSIATVAGKMFSRWSQENFFRYMLQDFDLDKMIEYGIEEIDPGKKVVNPSYRQLTYQIKKLKEKKGRLEAKMFNIIEENLDTTIDHIKTVIEKEADLQEKIQIFHSQIEQKLKEKEQFPAYIELKEMPENKRYNKLKTESKLFINTIKMIAYRAETAVTNLLSPFYAKAENEIRMLVKEIIKSDADLVPDYESKTLTVRLHSLSTPRANSAAFELCKILNESETKFPDTDLRLIYKIV